MPPKKSRQWRNLQASPILWITWKAIHLLVAMINPLLR